MGELIDLAFPRTDAGALAQVAVAVPAIAVGAWLARRNRDVMVFVIGSGILLLAWFALRALH